MTREVPLSNGMVALVDDADYATIIARGKWHGRPSASGVYYASETKWRDGKCVNVLMHKLLTGWEQTDHVDGDGLNNTRANLRPATRSQNGGNRGAPRNNTSGYKGVSRQRDRWVAFCAREYLGLFDTPDAAALAYNAAALRRWGAYAHLNVILERTGP